MFGDRADAGRQLAEELKERLGDEDVVVLGLPRGGVPVAFEVARELDAPLDVIVVRKLGVPYQPELGMGAIGEDGVRVLNDQVLAMARVGEDEVAAVERSERAELERRARRFRGDRPRASLVGRSAVVVDDGIATGSTARAACQVARAHGASRVILAVPVAPRSSLASLAEVADELVCLAIPEPFFAVGQFYWDFSQTSDEEVVELLERAATRTAAPPVAVSADPPVRDEDVVVQTGAVRLVGHLTVPEVCCWAGRLRPWQREQSSQSAQPLRRGRLELDRARNPPFRPPHPRRGDGPQSGLRHRALGRPARVRHRVAGGTARSEGTVHRLLRGQHRGRRRPLGGRRARFFDCARSSLAADVPISPVRSSARYERRPCSSWAAATRWCSSSTVRRRSSCVARASSRSCPVPPTSSRSPEP